MAIITGLMDSWKDSYTVRRVYGDPIEKDGVIVIPVAKVAGGGGGGAGAEPGEGEGEGGGFGGMAKPVGVYVVTAEGVQWKPALDITALGMAGIALGALITVVLGRSLRRKH